jgi:hypothetical protein
MSMRRGGFCWVLMWSTTRRRRIIYGGGGMSLSGRRSLQLGEVVVIMEEMGE